MTQKSLDNAKKRTICHGTHKSCSIAHTSSSVGGHIVVLWRDSERRYDVGPGSEGKLGLFHPIDRLIYQWISSANWCQRPMSVSMYTCLTDVSIECLNAGGDRSTDSATPALSMYPVRFMWTRSEFYCAAAMLLLPSVSMKARTPPWGRHYWGDQVMHTFSS